MIISKTPFRISFVGGGTDNLKKQNFIGNVVSTAIDKFIYVGVNKKFDNQIRFSYSKTENVKRSNFLKHSMLKEILSHYKINHGIEVVSVADIPSAGSGLGSSSSFLVGAIKSLSEYLKIKKSPKQIADLACKIEINNLKKPIGMQDQYSAAYGGLNWLKFNNNKVNVTKLKIEKKRLENFEQSLFLFFSNRTRKSKNILSLVKKNENLKQLKKISELALNFKNELLYGDLNLLGDIIHESWILKQQLSKNTSNRFINNIYQFGINSGATGGKLLGAGGGGYLIFFVKNKNKKNFLKKMKRFNIINFNFYNEGSKIIYP